MSKVKLESKNFGMLRNEYGVSPHTLRKWLRKVPNLEVDNRATRDYTPKEVEMIYKHLGAPGAEFED